MRTLLVKGVLLLALVGCSEGTDSTDGNQKIPSEGETYEYAGAASFGDLVTFSVNKGAKSYSVDNETTGEAEFGSYSLLAGDLEDVLDVEVDGEHFYAVELDNKIIAANFPTGNPLNNISFGVSSELDNNDHLDKIQGDYVWIVIGDAPVNGSSDNKEWGVMTVGPSTWIKQSFASNSGTVDDYPELSPELFTGSLPLSSGDETGTWTINGANKERVDVTVNGSSDQITGFAYAENGEGAFLMDLGPGNGFLLGLKIVDGYDFATIAGEYKFVDVWFDGSTGAGNYSIDASGQVSWVHRDIDSNQATGSFALVSETLTLANVFRADDADIDGVSHSLYLVISGDIIMHFTFDNTNGRFVSYGAGAKI